MWDLKNLINQCVKCESKFTSTEKPLKLLPCLHSICLDCLSGRSANLLVRGASSFCEPVTKDGDGLKDGSCETTNNGSVVDEDENAPEVQSDDQTTGNGHQSGVFMESSVEVPRSVTPADNNDDHTKDKKEEKKELENVNKPTPLTECPVCKDLIDQPSFSLIDNMFAALDPGQPSTPKEEVSLMCTACEEKQDASFYCVQCEEWLCDSCLDAHKRVRITKDHTISAKDEVKIAASKSPWEQLMMCRQHKQEQLKFFCEKCETLTCRDCQLMDHQEHKYQFLDQAAEQYKARLKGSLALMGEKRAKLATSREEIEQKLQNCKEQKDTLQQDILKQADILVKGVRQAIWGVLSNLASFTDAATKRLNKEIDDMSDLIGKFDHCIMFMEDILKEGSSMSLLYSKGNVETKCRKVYHTQVDPQSLKGTLSIAYKHDVNWLLGNLNKIGAIYVNGVRYPPDKNGGQSSRPGQNFGYPDQRAGGFSGTSPHLQHMANQSVPGQRVSPEWSRFIQTVSKSAGQIHGPPNMTMSPIGNSAAPLPSQLTLPSNRRVQGNNMVPSWQNPPSVPGSSYPGHFGPGQMMTSQQQTSKPAFTPMRLHHRPAAHSSFPGPMDQRTQNMRSPPQFRQGGEASGTPRSSHSTPDPARPASAGIDGNTSLLDVKKERRDNSPDCVIMSSSMKSSRPSIFASPPMKQSETILEMQRNLDEVLRAVPMDLSDNMEHISGSRPRTSLDMERLKSPVPDTGYSSVCEDEELRESWQGGNSMPGFSLAQVDLKGDPNDDYCACCHSGGDVLCCDQCPRVYHLHCHVPELLAVPGGSFVCTICQGDNQGNLDESLNSGKRKHTAGMTDQEIKMCERILLELFCHPSSIPFQEAVNKEVPNYYKIITQPKDFTQIKNHLQPGHPNHYQSVKGFLHDVRQVFINCAIYNKIGSEVGKAGKIVRAVFESLVDRLFPQFSTFAKGNPTSCLSSGQQQQMNNENSNGEDGESLPKRAKVEPITTVGV